MTRLAEYGKFVMLFTGDLEGEGEKELEESGKLTNVQAMKVSDRGFKNSASENFLRQPSPKVSLISSKIGNRHGHLHKETQRGVQKAGSNV